MKKNRAKIPKKKELKPFYRKKYLPLMIYSLNLTD